MSPKVELAVTFFLGEFGVHKFMKKKIVMGILYLFTFGLFGIGWLVDCILALRRLLAASRHNKADAKPASQESPVRLPEKQEDAALQPQKKEKEESPHSDPTARIAYMFGMDYICGCRKKFIALDLETTGLSSITDRIIEVSAVVFENFLPTQRFTTLVNPERPIPSAATAVNGISDEDVQNAPKEAAVMHALCEFLGPEVLCGDIVVVAHNASFDILFLLSAFSRCGICATINGQDTLFMARRWNLDTTNKKLGTLAKYFSIQQEAAHRAEDDARVCGEIFSKMLQQREMEQNAKFDALAPLEQQTCKWVKKILIEADCSTELLTFASSTYLTVNCLYAVIKFKPKARRPYVLISGKAEIPAGLETAPAVKSEGEGFVRVFYQSPEELDLLREFIVERYKRVCQSAMEFLSSSDRNLKSGTESVFEQLTV